MRQKRQDVMEDLQVKVSKERPSLFAHVLLIMLVYVGACFNECRRQTIYPDEKYCCTQINALQAQNQRLMAHVGEVEAHKGMLTGQVTTLRSKWTNASNDNMRLQAELGTLRKTLQVLLASPFP